MQRVVRQDYAEVIDAALAILPQSIRSKVEGVDILTGVDPVFAGLHRYRDASYGRSYAETAHVAYPFHQLHLPTDRRATTMVLPQVPTIRTVIHELGHVLHELLRFDPMTMPITRYARTDEFESFAESFAAWALPFGHGYGAAKDRLYEKDSKTVDLFEELAWY